MPELAGSHRPAEVIAVCTEVLPEQLRPPRYDDSETEDDDTEWDLLSVSGDAWEAAQRAWWRPDTLPWLWARRRLRWLDGHHGPPVPLELAVTWLVEDEGLGDAAAAVRPWQAAESHHGWRSVERQYRQRTGSLSLGTRMAPANSRRQ